MAADAVAERDIARRADPEPSNREHEIVTIFLQTRYDGRGFFALFHYVWGLLYCIDDRYAKRVEILDGTQNYWDALFDLPAQSLPGTGSELVIPLQSIRQFAHNYPELIRENCDLEILIHNMFRHCPSGRELVEKFSDRLRRRKMNRVVETFARPKQTIIDKVDDFCRANLSDCYTIGLHLRTSQHLGVVIDSKTYVDECVVPAIERFLKGKRIDHYRIFVATCVGDYLAQCRCRFGERLITTEVHRKSDPGYDHFQIDATRYEKARDVLMDSLILSRCNHLFGVPSNVFYAPLIFNPELDFTIFDFATDLRESGAPFTKSPTAPGSP